MRRHLASETAILSWEAAIKIGRPSTAVIDVVLERRLSGYSPTAATSFHSLVPDMRHRSPTPKFKGRRSYADMLLF